LKDALRHVGPSAACDHGQVLGATVLASRLNDDIDVEYDKVLVADTELLGDALDFVGDDL
jgi:hypothetical protein